MEQGTLDADSEVAACLDYLNRFLEQFNELQVLALTFPLEELETFFNELETFLRLFKDRTGFTFAPTIMQRSLFCPDSEFMIVMHKVSLVDVKLPGIAKYKSLGKIAGAYSLQIFDPEQFKDQVKYFISMKYVHGLCPVGGINMEDGRTLILFYKEPGPTKDLYEAIEVVEESQFALLMPCTAERGDFEQKINSVQMQLDETYLSQTVLADGNEFVIVCQNVGDQ